MCGGAAPGATSPQGPLQDGYNSSPRADAIAEIPTRNRDTFTRGTDTLAAAAQSIHQSPRREDTAKRPQQAQLTASFVQQRATKADADDEVFWKNHKEANWVVQRLI